mmetsp:Transcript_60148/g.161374  ORF Transcript_60148/g.161374 Transcript_60148/m.161374 type:complete len:230 (-) Transcript_60148:133-822(-)
MRGRLRRAVRVGVLGQLFHRLGPPRLCTRVRHRAPDHRRARPGDLRRPGRRRPRLCRPLLPPALLLALLLLLPLLGLLLPDGVALVLELIHEDGQEEVQDHEVTEDHHEDEVENRVPPDPLHAVVHDDIPVLPAQNLEDSHEPPQEAVKVSTRHTLPRPRILLRVHLRAHVVEPRGLAGDGLPVLIKVKVPREYGLAKQSEDNHHQHEQANEISKLEDRLSDRFQQLAE